MYRHRPIIERNMLESLPFSLGELSVSWMLASLGIFCKRAEPNASSNALTTLSTVVPAMASGPTNLLFQPSSFWETWCCCSDLPIVRDWPWTWFSFLSETHHPKTALFQHTEYHPHVSWSLHPLCAQDTAVPKHQPSVALQVLNQKSCLKLSREDS